MILFSETLEHHLLFVFVMNRYILDVVGFQSIVECLNCFFIVNVAWRDASDHKAVRVAAKTLFQNGGQLALTVGDMFLNGVLVACEGCNTFS